MFKLLKSPFRFIHKIPHSQWQKSNLDRFYRHVIIKNPFYSSGIAPNPEYLRSCLWFFDNYFRDRVKFQKLYRPFIDNSNVELICCKEDKTSNIIQIRGKYKAPLRDICYELPESKIIGDLLPKELDTGYFELILPNFSNGSYDPKVVIQFAGTGDHGFKKRRSNLAIPLANNYKIGSLVLENPFYGKRKPALQNRSALLYLTDLALIGGFIATETPILIKFLEEQLNIYKIGVTGTSLGGHLACFAGCTNDRVNTPIIPTMSWSCSSIVWTEGLLSETIGWQQLTENLSKNPEYFEIVEKVIEDNKNLKSIGWKYQDQKYIKYKSTLEAVRILTSKLSYLESLCPPTNPELTHFVVMEKDAYYPQLDTIPAMQDIWPECKVISHPNYGHVEGYIRQNEIFTGPIHTAMCKLDESKYGGGDSLSGIEKFNEKLNTIMMETSKGSEYDWRDNNSIAFRLYDPFIVILVKLVRNLLIFKDKLLVLKDKKQIKSN